MHFQDQQNFSKGSTRFNHSAPGDQEDNRAAEVEDTDAALDEEEPEKNELAIEEADQDVNDRAKKGSGGPEEKDITD